MKCHLYFVRFCLPNCHSIQLCWPWKVIVTIDDDAVKKWQNSFGIMFDAMTNEHSQICIFARCLSAFARRKWEHGDGVFVRNKAQHQLMPNAIQMKSSQLIRFVIIIMRIVVVYVSRLCWAVHTELQWCVCVLVWPPPPGTFNTVRISSIFRN